MFFLKRTINLDQIQRFLFVLLSILIPIQYKFHKKLRPLSNYLADLYSSTIPFYVDKHLFFYATDLLILILFFLVLRIVSFKDLFLKGSAKYLTALLILSFLSLIFSKNSNYYLHYFRLVQFFVSILFFYCIAQALSDEKILKNIFKSILFLSLFECLVGIAQYFSGRSLGLKFLGEVSSKTAGGYLIHSESGTRWLLDHLFSCSPISEFLRAHGTLSHPNIFGGFLFFSSIMTFYLFYHAEKRAEKIILSIAIPLQIFTLFISFSKSAYLGWGLGVGTWFLLSLIKRKELNTRRLIQLGCMILISLFSCITLFSAQLCERLQISHAQKGDIQAIVNYYAGERIAYQNIAVEMIKAHPFLGVGFNNYLFEIQGFIQGTTVVHCQPVHNIFLLIASEVGILGLLSFLLFLISILKTGLKEKMTPLSITLFSVLAGFLLIAQCDLYLLTSPQGKLMFFLTTALFTRSATSL